MAFDVIGTTIGDAAGLAPSAAPDPLSCDDVNLAAAGLRAEANVVATPKPWGCDWHVPSKAGSPVLVLGLREVTGAAEAANPMLARSEDLGAPEVVTQYALGGEATYLWVLASIPLSTADDAPLASRSMQVFVAHEVLDLKPKEGRELAKTVAAFASARNPRITAEMSQP